MTWRRDLMDPVVGGGLALLAALSVMGVLLYGSAPATVEEARTRAWSSVRPEAFGPREAHARQRLEAARAAAEAGTDSVALAAYEEAREAAAAAWELAGDEAQTSAAIALWAEATLGAAEALLRLGSASGLAVDDNAVLREALLRAEEVVAAPVGAALEARAVQLRTRIERELRPGPLEWLPPWRR